MQLGNYTHEICKLSKRLRKIMEIMRELYNNEQKLVEQINEIINRYQLKTIQQLIFLKPRKDNTSIKNIQILRDIFLASNLKRLKQQTITAQYLANNLAKWPAVKSYDSEGKLVMPKMNTEVLRDLKGMIKDFKNAIYQKKIQILQAFEKDAREKITDYELIKEKFLNRKPHEQRLAIVEELKILEQIRSILGPNCPNFNLGTYIEIFHRKFQFCKNIDFDRNEREISAAIEVLVDKLKDKANDDE